MRILICGMDGYLGWTLAAYLGSRGHEIAGIDNFARRLGVQEMGSQSVLPIVPLQARQCAFGEHYSTSLVLYPGDMCSSAIVTTACQEFAPDAIVHLAEQPSAAFSMIDVAHAVETQRNNILGTLNLLYVMRAVCPQAHLLKLGTMGELGTPDSEIPEGEFPEGSSWVQTGRTRGNLSGLMFPRQAGSWYHQSKVHDTHNVAMACRIWGLRSTDVMQGIVYGTHVDEQGSDPRMVTRCDIDEAFGTIVHRFCAQATIGHPLTVYGTGGQQRGLLPLRDSMRCLLLALRNPPQPGEYRTFNQFAEVHSVLELAHTVERVGDDMGLKFKVDTIENPRVEAEEHRYEPVHDNLAKLGYRPSSDLEGDVRAILEDMQPHRARIEEVKAVLTPKVQWK